MPARKKKMSDNFNAVKRFQQFEPSSQHKLADLNLFRWLTPNNAGMQDSADVEAKIIRKQSNDLRIQTIQKQKRRSNSQTFSKESGSSRQKRNRQTVLPFAVANFDSVSEEENKPKK